MGWVSPTGFNDPDSEWTDETNAYDGDITNDVSAIWYQDDWTKWLELTHASFQCSKVQWYCRRNTSTVTHVKVDIYYSSAWHNVYNDVNGSDATWKEITFAQQTITAIRMAFYTIWADGGSYNTFCEVELWEVPVEAPTVTTQAVSDIGTTTATGNGNITDTGGEDASAWGTCLATTENPDTGDMVDAGSGSGGTGAFTTSIDGLSEGTHYYVRAYATNSAGTSYGSQVEFTAIHLLSCSDGFKGGDSASTQGTLGASITDGLKVGDAPSSLAVLVAAVSDGIKLGDSTVGNLTFTLACTDGLKLGDSTVIFLTVPLSVADGIKLGDSTSTLATLVAQVTDGLKLGDTPATLATLVASVVDGLKLGDSASTQANLIAAITDGLKLGDSTMAGLVYAVVVTDGLKVGDSPSMVKLVLLSVTDGLKLGDSVDTFRKRVKHITGITGRTIQSSVGRVIKSITGRDVTSTTGRTIHDSEGRNIG